MRELSDNQIKGLVGLGVLGISGGSFFLGYKVSEKRLRAHYEEIAQNEIAVAKRFYADLNEEAPDPEELLRQLHPESERVNPVAEEQQQRQKEEYQRRLQTLKYHPSHIEAPKETEEELEAPKEEEVVEAVADAVHNVFEDQPSAPEEDLAWDYEWEIANRKEGIPYIIHYDEFYANDDDYEQISFTYFEKDGTLVDSRDQMVDDVEKTVGINNMMMFGKGSKDPNVVYIRNEVLQNDYEIVRHEGSFGEVVHDIRHSDDVVVRTPRRRRRLED